MPNKPMAAKDARKRMICARTPAGKAMATKRPDSAIYRPASARDTTVMLTLCSGRRGAGGRWVDRGVAAARASKETMFWA